MEFVRIRPETPADHPVVHAVNERAFGRPDEARLVDAVRDEVSPCLSLVAELFGVVIGHALYTAVRVASPDQEWIAMALGPIAVEPEHQRQGVGGLLIEVGLDGCRRTGHDVVFVLGDPGYYPRFGFRAARPLGLCYPPCETDAFMVTELSDDAIGGRTGVVAYHAEFDSV